MMDAPKTVGDHFLGVLAASCLRARHCGTRERTYIGGKGQASKREEVVKNDGKR